MCWARASLEVSLPGGIFLENTELYQKFDFYEFVNRDTA